MKKAIALGAVLTGAVSLATTPAAAEVVTVGSSSDTWIRDGRSYTLTGVDPVLDSRFSFVPYIQFDLSGLNIDEISDATLTVNKVASERNDVIVPERFAVYGLTNEEGNTVQAWHETDSFDPDDGFNGLDFRNVGAEWVNDAGQNGVDRTRVFNLDADDGANVTESVNNDESVPETLTGPDLVTFLNQRVDDNGFVTFLIPVEADGGRGYGIASKENSANLAPTLTVDFTVIPEPASLGLLGLGGLTLLRRRRA